MRNDAETPISHARVGSRLMGEKSQSGGWRGVAEKRISGWKERAASFVLKDEEKREECKNTYLPWLGKQFSLMEAVSESLEFWLNESDWVLTSDAFCRSAHILVLSRHSFMFLMLRPTRLWQTDRQTDTSFCRRVDPIQYPSFLDYTKPKLKSATRSWPVLDP